MKKTYAIMAQSEKMWENEKECAGDLILCLDPYNIHDEQFMKDFIKYLKVEDVVYRGESGAGKNWIPKTLAKRLNGSVSTYQGIHSDKKYFSSVLLASGVAVSCSLENYKQSIDCWMNVNNSAPPNQVGVDVFPFAFGAYNNPNYKAINPYMGEDSVPGDDGGICATRNNTICNPDDGRSPTAYILKHNKVYDIKKLKF